MSILESIKPGLAVEVTTWENDGDDYRTAVQFDVNPEVVDDLVKMLSLFTSTHDGGIGNVVDEWAPTFDQYRAYMALERALTPALVDYLGINMSLKRIVTDGDDPDEDSIGVSDEMYETLGHEVFGQLASRFGLSSEGCSIRAISDISVYNIAGELNITTNLQVHL